MKKFLMLNLIILTIILLNGVVFADMGAPMIEPYDAVISNVSGANYYSPDGINGNYSSVGNLTYGEKIKIGYEFEEKNIVYGAFNLDDQMYYINLKDIELIDEDSVSTNNVDFENPKNMQILADEGIKMYKGPANAYSFTGTVIPKGAKITGYGVSNFGDNPWYYVTYNGNSGWICELNGVVGYETDIKIMTPTEIKIYEDVEKVKPIGTIPANTVISDFLAVDAWSFAYYVTYNNISGYVKFEDSAVFFAESSWKINYNGAKMYKTGTVSGEVLIEQIPNGTELNADYTTDIRAIGWIYTTYEGKSGWVLIAETQEIYDQYVEDEKNQSDEESNAIEDSNMLSNEVEENNIIENDKLESNTPKTGTLLVMIYIFVAVIIVLTAFVSIVLVNKKKK